jgi:colicin import membrane protein
MSKTRLPPLKVFATRIGLDEVAIAATSQQAALTALGVHANLFAQGAASVTRDADLIARALRQPGEPVRRRIAVSVKTFARTAPKPSKKKTDATAQKRDLAAKREAREAVAAAHRALKAFEREVKADLAAIENERHALDLRAAGMKTGHAARRRHLENALRDAKARL